MATPIRQLYVVAASPRTGSTLLCRTIRDTGVAGWPREYLNPGKVRAAIAAGHTSVQGYARDFLAANTSDEGRFGIKLMFTHVEEQLLRHGLHPLTFFGAPPSIWIWSRRRDRVAQGVSQSIMLQTAEVNSRVEDRAADQRRPEPVFDPDHIAGCVQLVEQLDELWAQFFAHHRIEPLEVFYEDLAADHVGTMETVFAHLGLREEAVPPPPLRKQGGDRNAAWVDRYRRWVEDRGAAPRPLREVSYETFLATHDAVVAQRRATP